MILDKLLNFSGTQVPQLQRGDDTSSCFIGFLSGIAGIMLVMCLTWGLAPLGSDS